MQIVNALKDAKQKLITSDSAKIDAESLLCSVLKCDRSKLYAYPEQVLSMEQQTSFNKLIALRAEGHPVAYLTGHKEFWSLNLYVSQATLIPRPETELLVETALTLIPDDKETKLLELGTGTGAIAIAIASERNKSNITATDLSAKALLVAQQNARSHHVENISFKEADWFEIADIDSYDLIISNPPYICADDPHLQQGDVQFEPVTALASGADGLNDIRTIIKQAQHYLNSRGWLLLEHGYNQAAQVRQLFKDNGYTASASIKDYSGIERISMGQLAHQTSTTELN
jgi:release factor glutamine methyltransferase